MIALVSVFVLAMAIQWLAWIVRLPAILLLLAGGFFVGPIMQWISPQTMFGDLLQPIVSLAVALILFEGGLNLRLSELQGSWPSLVRLLTVGVLVTSALATLAATWIFGISFSVALVLGTVVVVTGPTVIGPLLRELRPSGQVGAVAKWEGIVIDPIGATLALLVVQAIDSILDAKYSSATMSAVVGLSMMVVVGVSIGIPAVALLIACMRRFWIPDYLQTPVTLMFVIAAFAIANALHHESGLLAVTLMGVVLANQHWVQIQKIVEFKESLTVIMISVLFILLTAQISFESLMSVGWRGIAFGLVLVIVVRPVSVLISTLGGSLSWPERWFLAGFAPRGIVAAAVSSVFALRLGDQGTILAPATFLVIFVTVAIYGLTAGPLARYLGLAVKDAQGLLIVGANVAAREIAKLLSKQGFRVVLVDSNYHHIRQARDMGLSTCYANVLSEHMLDEIDFAGIGRSLSMTSNGEVNAMATARFREMFGRENVFQIANEDARHSRFEAQWQDHLAGRTLFAPKATYDWLVTALESGASLKITALTEKFSLESFQSHYGDNALPLFMIDGNRLTVLSTDNKSLAKPGQSLVSLILPAANEPNGNAG